MATRNSTPRNLPAGADLRTKENFIGKMVSGAIVLCSTLGERSDVVIGNAPNIGEAVEYYDEDHAAVKVGAVAVAIGAELTTDANGLAITAVTGNVVFGKAREAGAASAVIGFKFVPAYVKP